MTSSQHQHPEHPLGAIILAAGKGTRMDSNIAKVLHKIAGKPMLHYVIRTAQQLQASKTAVVIGHQADQVQDYFKAEKNIDWVMQNNPKGTGDAVARAKEIFTDFSGPIVILYGDIPGIRVETLRRLWMMHESGNHALTILTAELDDPTGYGRVIVNADGSVSKIVEHRDATAYEREIYEINTGIGIYDSKFLWENITQLKPANKQNELYLTDLVEMARSQNLRVGRMVLKESLEIMGINDRSALADVTRFFFDEKASYFLDNGVHLEDPASITLESDVKIGQDSTLQGEVIVRGQSQLGENTQIASGTCIINSQLGNGVKVANNCSIYQAELGENVRVGANTVLGEE
ncbi:MAG TPA: NTP transferase domain-containing protein [Oligoflexia bacterium]|nr:NTP transferase domain-containing protein [Oligoflexia bacterium]HMR25468.1 NTP transferase domain-containing protein [Oligoflexia bacterium]